MKTGNLLILTTTEGFIFNFELLIHFIIFSILKGSFTQTTYSNHEGFSCFSLLEAIW